MSNTFERISIIYVVVYKMDKLFDKKIFPNFGQFEFWINKMTIPWHMRQKTNKDYINKIKIYESMTENGNLRLLSTWIFNDGQLKYQENE